MPGKIDLTFPKKTLLVVVGPTAVGKTAMSIVLARYLRTEIISADSRQFYKEMNIGTAKPTEDELAAVPHHFIDSHSIEEEYSAGDFERDALVLLQTLFRKHDVVIMVGGSGLFVRSVCEGLDDLPKVPAHIRDGLNAQYSIHGLKMLQERLQQVDPDYYAKMDISNPQRVIRALEVYDATGKPLSFYQKKDADRRSFDILTVGINMDRQRLYERINRRVDSMIRRGLVEEVRGLIAHRNKPALLTVGYAEIFDHLDGKISLEEAIDRIRQNSRRYAKRQITRFKKYGNTTWFTPEDEEGIYAFIRNKLAL